MRLMRGKKFRRDQGGIAAVEFAIILGPLMVLVLGVFEVTLRVQAADEFERYAFQIGDVLSRDEGLTSNDLDVLYKSADVMMQQVHVIDEMLDMDIASIGYQADGDPVLLWRRYRGSPPDAIDLESAVGLGEAGDSVIRVSATLRYTSPIELVPFEQATMTRFSFFKPRTTRAISMDGKLVDAGVTWDFYSQ